MLPVIEAFTEDIKKVNTLLQLATLTRNILQKLTIKDIQVVTLPDNYFKFKFVTEDGSTIETNSVFIGESISIDDALSLLSTNPVQNKVITAAINSVNENISSLNDRIDSLDTQIGDISLVLNKLAEIKDQNGNYRFVEGNIDTSDLQAAIGASNIRFAKWSLSGTHLMFVLAFTMPASISLDGIVLGRTLLPSWIMNKLERLIPGSSILSFTDTFGRTQTPDGFAQVKCTCEKGGDGYVKLYTWDSFTSSAVNTGFRIQFDFIID